MKKNPHIFQPTEKGKKAIQAFKDEEEKQNKCNDNDDKIEKSK